MIKGLKLIGFNITKIQAEKKSNLKDRQEKQEKQEKLEINSNINIQNVEKYKSETLKQDSLKISFNFNILYGELGDVSIEGVLFLLIDQKSMKEALNDWKNKKISEELNMALLNIIIQKTSVRAFQLEEELGLPFHLQLPRIQKSKTE